MGSKHVASCVCGFQTRVTVGGGMMTFQENSPFPYYCARCGLVEANTALKVPVCPSCGSKDIHQYGLPPVSVIPDRAHSVLQSFSFKAYANNNLCPACKKMTLVFEHATSMFD